MGYNRQKTNAKPLPGSSIKGAGSLAPGLYTGFFETKRINNQQVVVFVSMPAGIHFLSDEPEASAAVTPLPLEQAYRVTIALSRGCGIARTDGGRFYVADSVTREAKTEEHTDIHALLREAAQKNLTFSTPVVVEIKGAQGDVVFQRGPEQ